MTGRRCVYCRADESASNPLVYTDCYVGGHGYKTVGPECQDVVGCAERMDRLMKAMREADRSVRRG